MNLIMLSGNSLRNRDWIQSVQKQIAHYFDQTYIQPYRHWENGDEWIDLAHEQEILKDVAADYEPYGVLSKSIGTALTVQSITKQNIKPQFLLLLGLPLGYIDTDYPTFFTELLKYSCPIVIVQNTNDPIGSSEDVRTRFNGELPANISFIETPGETHDYLDMSLISEKLENLLTLCK